MVIGYLDNQVQLLAADRQRVDPRLVGSAAGGGIERHGSGLQHFLTVGVDDDQLVLDSVVGFGTSDSLEEERKGDSG